MTTIERPTVNGASVRDRVIAALEAAARENAPRPGRPALARMIGASEHQVRVVLDQLAAERANPVEHTAPGKAEDTSESANVANPVANPVADPGDLSPGITTAPALAGARPWPLVLIGFAAAVAVWSGWVGLGKLTGFGVIEPLPGLLDGFTINTAVVLPISVEAYAAYALRVWLSRTVYSEKTVRFARVSSIASLVIGAVAQVAYHLMVASGVTRAPWPVVVLVSIVPVVVLGLASALAKLVTSDRQTGHAR